MYLVTLHSPDLQNSGLYPHQLIPLCPVEDGTTVGSIVVLDVHARRVGLGEECSAVSLCTQNLLQELKVIHLLETNTTKIKTWVYPLKML